MDQSYCYFFSAIAPGTTRRQALMFFRVYIRGDTDFGETVVRCTPYSLCFWYYTLASLVSHRTARNSRALAT